MEEEAGIGRRKDLVSQIEREDLSDFSLKDLDDRIAALAAEIERCKALRARKSASLTDADKLFRF